MRWSRIGLSWEGFEDALRYFMRIMFEGSVFLGVVATLAYTLNKLRSWWRLVTGMAAFFAPSIILLFLVIYGIGPRLALLPPNEFGFYSIITSFAVVFLLLLSAGAGALLLILIDRRWDRFIDRMIPGRI